MQAIAAFMTLANTIKRGDIVGVVGQPGKTKRGELSIFPTSLELLTPCLHMMPKTTYGARRSTARPDAHPGAPCSCAALARGVQAAATPQPPLWLRTASSSVPTSRWACLWFTRCDSTAASLRCVTALRSPQSAKPPCRPQWPARSVGGQHPSTSTQVST